jgi:hypothetical protein
VNELIKFHCLTRLRREERVFQTNVRQFFGRVIFFNLSSVIDITCYHAKYLYNKVLWHKNNSGASALLILIAIKAVKFAGNRIRPKMYLISLCVVYT